MNRDGYETSWTGPGESITGNGPHHYATEDVLGYREELTASGPQLVIPGCERRAPDNGKPAQLSLFA